MGAEIKSFQRSSAPKVGFQMSIRLLNDNMSSQGTNQIIDFLCLKTYPSVTSDSSLSRFL